MNLVQFAELLLSLRLTPCARKRRRRNLDASFYFQSFFLPEGEGRDLLNGCIRTNGHILFCIRFSRFSAFPHHIKPDSIVPSIRKKVELFWTRKSKFNFASIFPSRENGSISRLKGSTAANVFRAPEANICGTQTGRKIAFTKNNFNAIFWRKRATEQVCPQLF